MKNKILNSLISGLIGASIIVALVIMAKQNVVIEKPYRPQNYQKD